MATFGGQEAGLPDFGSPWAPNRRQFPLKSQIGCMEGGWHQNFCWLPEKEDTCPKTAIFAPKFAFLGTYRHCRQIWYPVGWLVGGLVVVARGLLYR